MSINLYTVYFLLLLSLSSLGQADFEIPEKVCVNTPFNIINKTNGASNYFWSFCVADPNKSPIGTNLGNIGNYFSQPVFMDYAFENGNYYGFVTNHYPGGLTRLDFGNSLLNTPNATYLGNFGGVLPPGVGTEGIQIIKNEGKWYAIIVGGNPAQGSAPRIVKIDFGANLNNPAPIATNWGNLGNLNQPIDLHVFQENGNWYGFTVNAENNTITRFNFSNSFENTPSAINLGNIGSLNYPTGIYAISNQGSWYVFIVNGGTSQISGVGSSLTRLNFGNSLLNTPTGINLGNPGNILQHPRDLTVYNYCDQIIGFAVNGRIGYNDIVKIDFKNNLTLVPTFSTIGNIGSLNFPHSISKIFRVENDLYAFVTNVSNNSLTRLKFSGCSDSNIPGSTQEIPPPIVYASPGTYNISLTIDEGLPTQSTKCKQIIVEYDQDRQDFSFIQDNCNPLMVKFFNSSGLENLGWDFGDGTPFSNSSNPIHLFSKAGEYKVSMWYRSGPCGIIDTIYKKLIIMVDTTDIILNADTILCNGTLQLSAKDAAEYCWTPSTFLNDPNIKNPIATPLSDITYRLISKTQGSNLVVNGNFSAGANGFTTEYKIASINVTEGEYWVGSNPSTWNSGMFACTDHTGGNGNMLMVNGSPQNNAVVWQQTINVETNTTYEFSTWLQSLYPVNPAQLQFSINGIQLGEIFVANSSQCIWSRFSTFWNSGDSTKATISIINKNTIALGNDFALDDISFSPIKYNTDTVQIRIDKPAIKVSNDTIVCRNTDLQLFASGAQSYIWSPSNGLSDINIPNPVLRVFEPVKVIVVGKNDLGCEAKDSVFIDVYSSTAGLISKDTALCAGSSGVQLLAGGGKSYEWVPSEGLNNAFIFNPLASPVESTKYYLRVTDFNDCVFWDSLKVDVLPLPKTFVSNDTSVCKGNSIRLKAEGGEYYQWYPSTGLSDPFSDEPIATPITDIKYYVEIGNSNDCKSIDSVSIIVKNLPVLTKSSDTAVCKGKNIPLFVSGGSSYSWSPVSGLNNPFISNPIAEISSPIVYTVTVFDQNGCFTIDSIKIGALEATGIEITKDTSVCTNSSIELKITGSASQQWFPTALFSDPLIPNPTVTALNNSKYWVEGLDVNGCPFSDSVKVSLIPVPEFGIKNNNIKSCANQPIQLEAYGGDNFQWIPTTGLSNPNIANPIATLAGSIVFNVRISEWRCNYDTIFSVPVEIVPLTNTRVIKSNDISCDNPTSNLMASGGISYKWFPAAGLSNSVTPNPIASPAETTLYFVEITGVDGCIAKDSIEVSVTLEGDLKIFQMPNAFTPNGDGLNDCFGIKKWGNVEIEYFNIFNRWGQMIFNGKAGNSCWDGKLNGINQPSGNYIYKIKVKTICGVVERKGSFMLLR